MDFPLLAEWLESNLSIEGFAIVKDMHPDAVKYALDQQLFQLEQSKFVDAKKLGCEATMDCEINYPSVRAKRITFLKALKIHNHNKFGGNKQFDEKLVGELKVGELRKLILLWTGRSVDY